MVENVDMSNSVEKKDGNRPIIPLPEITLLLFIKVFPLHLYIF